MSSVKKINRRGQLPPPNPSNLLLAKNSEIVSFNFTEKFHSRQPRKSFLPKDFFDLHGIRRALFKKIPNS